MKPKQQSQRNILLPLAAAVCAISLAVMALALAAGAKKRTAEFVPPPFDLTAETGAPDVPEDLGFCELDAQAFKASVCGVVILRGEKADIWLTSPESNEVWLKARILDQTGNILGETGLIKPGEYVRSVTFDRPPQDGEAITLKLMAYELETYYSGGSASLKTTVTKEGGG